MMATRRLLAGVALSLFLSVPAAAKAPYNFTQIHVPGSRRTAANGNSTHEIVGEYDDANGDTHGFILDKSGFTPVDVSGAVVTTVNGVNAVGQLAGIYIDAGGFHGFFWNNGVVTTIDGPGAIRTLAFFLTAQAHVVGTYRSPDNKRHGYIWDNGNFTTLNVPGDSSPLGTSAIGINDNGDVVGTYVDGAGNRHGFLLSKGVYTTLDVPGAAFTVAQGI